MNKIPSPSARACSLSQSDATERTLHPSPSKLESHGFIRKYELAFRYFPNAPTKKAATDNLTRAINRCTPLLMALAKASGGYNTNDKWYSPQQLHLIYEYLGEP